MSTHNTPQPVYDTVAGVQANFRVSYPICVVARVKCIGYIGKGVLNSHLGPILIRVIPKSVLKRTGVYVLWRIVDNNPLNYHEITTLFVSLLKITMKKKKT